MEKYVSYLCGQLDLLDIRFLFDLIHENIIPFSTDISDYLLNVINQEVKKRESQQGYRVIPDSLAIAIHAFILFSLMGERVDLSNLAPYAQYDKFLEFILAPDEFDYTKVDTRDYLWQRLISSKQYQRHFVRIILPALNSLQKLAYYQYSRVTGVIMDIVKPKLRNFRTGCFQQIHMVPIGFPNLNNHF